MAGRAWMLVVLAAVSAPSQVSVVTGQYDLGRTSTNPAEIVLNTSNVNSIQFGRLFSRQVDGFIFVQPLYLSDITIQGTTRNVVYVATANNSVYAFDADDPEAGAPLWQVNLGPVVPAPGGRLMNSDMGILSTPVVDPIAGAIYVVALLLRNTVRTYELHALDVVTGQEKLGSPVTMQATVPGSSPDNVSGQVSFNAAIQWQRPALLLYKGSLFIAFGTGTQETNTYHGWLLQYDAATLQQIGASCTTPNGSGGGIWMSGYGPAADDNGVYYTTGNGSVGDGNSGESVVRFGPSIDLFVPYDFATLNMYDLDLGTTGPMLLPGTNLLVVGGKNGMLYVLNRNNLGGVQAGNTQIVQSFLASGGCSANHCSHTPHPTVWSRPSSSLLLYSWASTDVLRGFGSLSDGRFNTTPFAEGIVVAGPPGGILALSSNGEATGSGVLWATMATQNALLNVASGTLYAFDAATLSELWDSGKNAQDWLGNFAKYSTPTIANGKVYVATFSGQLTVYGLRTLSNDSLNFGNQIIGMDSTAQEVTFTNAKSTPLAMAGITANGDFAASSTCAASLIPGASCVISVTFTPTGLGTRTGSVIITDAASGSRWTINLSGIGAAAPSPFLSLSAASLVFGGQVIATSGAAQVVTLNNTGNAPLVLAMTVSGDFTETDNCGTTLAVGAACNINVSFAPTAIGTRNGTITVADNAPNNPHIISLTGTGMPYAVPQVSGMLPASASLGGTGFTLTLNGTGFVPGTAVYWNGQARSTAAISSTQLQMLVNAADVAVAGTVAISVFNPSPGGGFSNVMMLPVTNATTSVLLSRSDVPSGTSPSAVMASDLNADGKLDVIAANSGDNTISILLGNGDATFQSHVDYATGQSPRGLAVGDFNADGRRDIAVANQADGTISILLGNGDGTFQIHLDYVAGQSPASLSAGDFDADGKLDVAVVNAGSNTVSVLLGNGDGTFQTHVDYATGHAPASLVAGDFNNDGRLDLALVNNGDNTVSVLLGNGDGTFQPHVDYGVGPSPASLVAGDFNNDRTLDLVLVNTAGNSVSVLLGNGDGTFRTRVDYATGQSPVSLVAADFNGDGNLDVVASNLADDSVSILFGKGDGILQTRLDEPANTNPGNLAVGDFNGDGRLDLVVTSGASNVISALFQRGAVSLSKTNLTYASQNLGSTAPAQTVTLSNTGSASLIILGITATGDFAAGSTCGSALVPGADCVISTTFTPTGVGLRTGAVIITDGATDSPQTINLTGTSALNIMLNLSPNVIVGGVPTAANTISLSSPAPPSGVVVNLTSSNPGVASSSSTVTVPPGATVSAPFAVTTAPVSAPTMITLTASYGASAKTANLTIYPAVLYSVYPAPNAIYGGLASTANRVGLYGQAPTAGAQVTLSSSNPAVASVPAFEVVPFGSNVSPQFTISTTGVSTQTTVLISATYRGVTKTANLNVLPASISQVTLASKGVVGGAVVSSNTASLLGQAPPGGGEVTLSSANPAIVAVPPTVTVPAGSNISQVFAATTTPVTTLTTVAISATYNGVTKFANLVVVPPTLYILKLSADTIKGGTPVYTNRLGLTGPAPAGGLVITLSSSNPAIAKLPQSVAIPAGASYSPPFSITTNGVTTSTLVTISASYGGTTKSTVLTVTP